MVTDGDAAPCASRRCYTFALHQSHGIPMPKKVTSNRNLEQWFGSAMITVGHWGIWNTMEYPCQPKGYNVGFCNFLIGWLVFFPNISNKLLKNILTTLVCWHPLRAPRIWWEHYLRSQIPFWCSEICWISEKSLHFTKSTNGRSSFLCVRSTADSADWLSCCTVAFATVDGAWWGISPRCPDNFIVSSFMLVYYVCVCAWTRESSHVISVVERCMMYVWNWASSVSHRYSNP